MNGVRADCLREVRSSLVEKKPLVLVHEADPAKGGLTLEAAQEECLPDLRPIVFTKCQYDVSDSGRIEQRPQDAPAAARQVTT